MSTPLAFQPARFGALALRNRIVMAPMTRRMAGEDGLATEAIRAYYARRARHEVGLIVSEGTGIDSLHAYDTLSVPRFETAAQHAAWRAVVEAVHAEGGAFAPQLWHCGRMSADPIGPSPGEVAARGDRPARAVRAMEADDFAQVLAAYASAAAAARAIGCDALEVHGAHGYLLDSFLSPATNQRSDAYGGSFSARMRFPLEVARAVRAAVGPDFPVIYRFSQWQLADYAEVKWRTPDELGAWVNALKDAGVDLLHVSTRDATAPGFPDAGPKTLAGWARELSGLPVIAVGKVSVTLTMDRAYGEERDVVRDPGPALALLERGEADLLAVGRALIANPDWVQVVRDRDWRELRAFDAGQLAALV
ncbi:MAG: 12-oxophytodienoate reductase [Planctomycetes bacterium]|nr:12-oxophytodienoate reductase [Planctomycetota bacterium]